MASLATQGMVVYVSRLSKGDDGGLRWEAGLVSPQVDLFWCSGLSP
jgi:hypothetical protein